MRHAHRLTYFIIVMLIAGTIGHTLDGHSFAAPRASQASAKPEDFNAYFVLAHDAKGPAGFKNFSGFELNTMQYKPSGSVPIKPNGVVYVGRKYKMARIDIVGESLSFETVNLAGITYQFNGRLVRPYNPDGPAMSGWLIKTVNGKKAAEAQVNFYIEEGD